LEQVGLYTSGFAIINTFLGMVLWVLIIFTTCGSRSAITKLWRKTINEQAEIGILILAPILIIFLVLYQVDDNLLYSNIKFITVK
jgi:hypothetical protein